MKLFSLSKKPALDSRDPAARAKALGEATEAELATKAPELARTDPHADVRVAAVRRLRDLSLLGDRMRHDTDARVRDAARARLKSLLVMADIAATERERFLRVEDDQDILAAVATGAGEPALRRLALERSTRAGLLTDRCLRDPDPSVRLWLLSRIDQPNALERIADSARKTDKALSRAARERIESLKLAAGDPATLQARALALCDAVDRLRREPADAEREAVLRGAWSQLEPRVTPEMRQRVQGYFTMLEAARAPRAEAPAAVEPAITPDPASTTPSEDDLAVVAAAAAAQELDAAARVNEQAKRAEERVERERRHAAERALEETLHEAFTTAANGQARTARMAFAKARTLRESLGTVSPLVARRFTDVEAEIEKLDRWQRWSNNKVRARLCEELEAFIETKPHPDALAAKVKEMQAQWQKLDEIEGVTEPGKSGLDRRFRGLTHRGLAPARQYFEKRRELRDAKQSTFDQFINEVEQQLADPHHATQPPLRSRIVEQLRHIDELDPRHRGEFAKRLRGLLTRIDESKTAQRAEAEAAKRKLIANLRREVARAELADALDRAKNAQATWKTLPRADREVEDALYAELRAIVDPIFEKDATARGTVDAERTAREAEAQAILAEMETLASDPEHLHHADSRLAQLEARWRALEPPRAPESDRFGGPRGGRGGPDARGARDDRGGGARGGRDERGGPASRGSGDGRRGASDGRGSRDDRGGRGSDRPDERAYDRAIERVRSAQLAAASNAQAAALQRAHEASALLARIEIGDEPFDTDDALTQRIAALDLPAHAHAALTERAQRFRDFRSLDQAARDSMIAEQSERALDLLVRMELVAERESPPAHRDRRRRVQLERLASRMTGGAPTDESLDALRVAYFEIGPLSRELRAECEARLEALKPL